MGEESDDRTHDLPPWEGSERFWDARDKHVAGDQAGAFLAYAEIIGPTVREYSDNELPYVAAALAAVASVVDTGGDTREAVAAYNLAVRFIESNESRLKRYVSIWDTLPKLRERRDVLTARVESESASKGG